MTDLFTPLSIGAMALPNRIIMAPMTRNRAPESIPVPLMATYYSQRAEAGLLITEGSQISTEAVGYPGTPGIHTDAQVDGWKLVTDAVHAKGGRIFLQLWHCGRASHPDFHGGKLPVAPSAIAPIDFCTIDFGPSALKSAFATTEVRINNGARFCKKAGDTRTSPLILFECFAANRTA